MGNVIQLPQRSCLGERYSPRLQVPFLPSAPSCLPSRLYLGDLPFEQFLEVALPYAPRQVDISVRLRDHSAIVPEFNHIQVIPAVVRYRAWLSDAVMEAREVSSLYSLVFHQEDVGLRRPLPPDYSRPFPLAVGQRLQTDAVQRSAESGRHLTARLSFEGEWMKECTPQNLQDFLLPELQRHRL